MTYTARAILAARKRIQAIADRPCPHHWDDSYWNDSYIVTCCMRCGASYPDAS